MSERAVYGLCARIANWVQVSDFDVFDAHPDTDTARDMIEYAHADLPPLEEIITAPVFAADGELIVQPGYHREHRLFFAKEGGVLIDDVPEAPSEEQVEEAVDALTRDLLGDFPFATDADKAHAIGAVVEPSARRLYKGRSPLHSAEAPTPGSGKGLLVDAVSIVCTGAAAHARMLPRSEEEGRKAVTASLISSPTLVVFDNFEQGRVVDSATLSAALTAERWSDRLLGYSRMVWLPNRVLYFLTGNNPRYSLELARRCVRIRLDPGVDRPWLRQNFLHPDLRGWARRNRARLVRAVLIIIRHWIASGRPKFGTRLGSFESWSEVIGGILECAGIPGFLQNRDELYEFADAEGGAWREFVGHWWSRHGNRAVKPSALRVLCDEEDLLGEVLGDGSPASKDTRLGFALKTHRDRVYGRFRIELARDDGRKGRAYRLACLERGEDVRDVDPQRPRQRPLSQPPDSTSVYGGGGTLGDVERTPTSPRRPLRGEGTWEGPLDAGPSEHESGAWNVPQRPPDDATCDQEGAYRRGRWPEGGPERPPDPPWDDAAGPEHGGRDG